jgi:hypothetical protein
VGNDPTFTEIEIDNSDDYHDLFGGNLDWGDIGRAVGKNTNLRDISLSYDFDDPFGTRKTFDDLMKFLTAFAMNQSIRKRKLKIGGWDLDRLSFENSNSLFNALTQFFMNYQAFECLVVETSHNDERYTDQMCDIAVKLLR